MNTGKWVRDTVLKWMPVEAIDDNRRYGGLVSAEMRRETREREEQREKAIEQVRQAMTVILPHNFSIAGQQLQTIVQLVEEGKKRIDCRLVERGKIIVLSAPEILVGRGGGRRRMK
jgi:hypothetical protein